MLGAPLFFGFDEVFDVGNIKAFRAEEQVFVHPL
jgi:hypothetical protein